MDTRGSRCRAIFSSDWSECLSPCGPFDFISFTYPQLGPELSSIFKKYTGNEISLSDATRRIAPLLPGPITEEQMDAYLDECFATYKGVPELIEWCGNENILFMINTTGMQGYFQRAFKKGFLPDVPVVSAHPMVRYEDGGKTPRQWYDLLEIRDKPLNTQKVMRALDMPPKKIILMGDSGGDGPHFEWGAGVGAFLVGSMTKSSLSRYCSERGMVINLRFGLSYSEGEQRDKAQEMGVNFMDLIPEIAAVLGSCQDCAIHPSQERLVGLRPNGRIGGG